MLPNAIHHPPAEDGTHERKDEFHCQKLTVEHGPQQHPGEPREDHATKYATDYAQDQARDSRAVSQPVPIVRVLRALRLCPAFDIPLGCLTRPA